MAEISKDHTTKKCKVLFCTCSNASQDVIHGAQMRAHNPFKSKTAGKTGYRCTVCRKQQDL